jgi:hypothetical protein
VPFLSLKNNFFGEKRIKTFKKKQISHPFAVAAGCEFTLSLEFILSKTEGK